MPLPMDCKFKENAPLVQPLFPPLCKREKLKHKVLKLKHELSKLKHEVFAVIPLPEKEAGCGRKKWSRNSDRAHKDFPLKPFKLFFYCKFAPFNI